MIEATENQVRRRQPIQCSCPECATDRAIERRERLSTAAIMLVIGFIITCMWAAS